VHAPAVAKSSKHTPAALQQARHGKPSHSSGKPLALQSSLVGTAMSVPSQVPLPLQSQIDVAHVLSNPRNVPPIAVHVAMVRFGVQVQFVPDCVQQAPVLPATLPYSTASLLENVPAASIAADSSTQPGRSSGPTGSHVTFC
jgi:hypothetical protein